MEKRGRKGTEFFSSSWITVSSKVGLRDLKNTPTTQRPPTPPTTHQHKKPTPPNKPASTKKRPQPTPTNENAPTKKTNKTNPPQPHPPTPKETPPPPPPPQNTTQPQKKPPAPTNPGLPPPPKKKKKKNTNPQPQKKQNPTPPHPHPPSRLAQDVKGGKTCGRAKNGVLLTSLGGVNWFSRGLDTPSLKKEQGGSEKGFTERVDENRSEKRFPRNPTRRHRKMGTTGKKIRGHLTPTGRVKDSRQGTPPVAACKTGRDRKKSLKNLGIVRAPAKVGKIERVREK